MGKEVWFVLESMAIYFVIENGCMDCQDDPRLKCPGSRRRCNECSVYCGCEGRHPLHRARC